MVASSLATSVMVLADAGTTAGASPPVQRSATDAVQQSTNPVPTTTQLTFEPEYTFPNGQSRYIAQLLFQPILPYQGFLIPDLVVPGFRSVARVQVSGLSLERTAPSGTISASGLSDLFLLDGVVRHVAPLEVGAGFGAAFPMGTNPALTQGKLQLGPSAILALLDIPWLQVGALAQVLWSVAGDSQRSALADLMIQPIFTLLLPSDCSVFSNDTMSFYWVGTGTTVPINLGFGHGFSEHFVGQIQSAYVVSGSGQGSLQGLLVLNFQP